MGTRSLALVLLMTGLFILSACGGGGSSNHSSSAPTITGFSPTSGSAGAEITITGAHFSLTAGNNTVAFNGVQATVNSATATELVVVVPAGATTGKITVLTSGKTATSVSDFTVVTGPSLVSVNTAGTAGNNGSYVDYGRTISDDGRYVVFYSGATNLVAGDTNEKYDIFIRDTTNNTTERVSVDSNENEATGHSYAPNISSNGRYVAFYSEESFGVADENSTNDVFVRDRTAGTTTCVSMNDAGTQTGNGESSLPSVSDNGLIAFQSQAGDLISGGSSDSQIFVRNLDTGTTSLVSRATGASGSHGNNPSYHTVITPDGRYVAFASFATNLTSGDSNGTMDVFVRDLATDTTTCASVNTSGTQTGNSYSDAPAITPDGRYVAFYSSATDLVAGGTSSRFHVFVRDMVAGTTTLVSVDSSGVEANNHSQVPTISSDGRYIAFQSSASNLVADDTNTNWDVFLRDRVAGTTTRLSTGPGGIQANGASNIPFITSDGRVIVFRSQATNLTGSSVTGEQMYRRRLD